MITKMKKIKEKHYTKHSEYSKLFLRIDNGMISTSAYISLRDVNELKKYIINKQIFIMVKLKKDKSNRYISYDGFYHMDMFGNYDRVYNWDEVEYIINKDYYDMRNDFNDYVEDRYGLKGGY